MIPDPKSAVQFGIKTNNTRITSRGPTTLNNHSHGKPQPGIMRPQRSNIREINKGEITISLGRNTPTMALLSEGLGGVIIQNTYFKTISFILGVDAFTEGFGFRF
jgi:hypothetical protein